jgi:SAM-dependent methyltransferase
MRGQARALAACAASWIGRPGARQWADAAQESAAMHRDPEPSRWVTRFASLVRPGAAILDLACGRGRHTRWFHARGHPVAAVDLNVSGLEDLRGQATLELIEADLEGAPWPLPGRRFGAVIVTNYLWRPLFPSILESVDEDGVLLYDTFARGNEAYGRPTNPAFLLEPSELIEVVRGRLQIVAYEHGHVERPRPAIRQRLCAVRSDRPVSLGAAS